MTVHNDARTSNRARIASHRLPDGAMAMPIQSLERPGFFAALRPIFATFAIWK